MFGLFSKKEQETLCAPVTGEMIDIAGVSDVTFANRLLGDGVAFRAEGDVVTVYAPVSGKLESLFPTGHAFGIEAANGLQILVHIGINTVEANGDGFRVLSHSQGEKVKAGDALIEYDAKKLSEKYDTTVMLVITDDNGHELKFKEYSRYEARDVITEG
uniref:PTS sugar transporter subunit IIA n=1 Tax=Eubacterium cellulosolvens TaxID=29322 RepID=UPI000484FBD4|nr:PTS glucose transporter subunit IIA [[Eubacterium] cellulosolvens]